MLHYSRGAWQRREAVDAYQASAFWPQFRTVLSLAWRDSYGCESAYQPIRSGPVIQPCRLIILETGEAREPPGFLGFCAASRLFVQERVIVQSQVRRQMLPSSQGVVNCPKHQWPTRD